MTPEALAAKYFPESDERAARAAACVREALVAPPQTPQERHGFQGRDTYATLLESWREQDQALQDIFGACGVDATISCRADVAKIAIERLEAAPPQTALREQIQQLRRWGIHGAIYESGYNQAIADVLAIEQPEPQTTIPLMPEQNAEVAAMNQKLADEHGIDLTTLRSVPKSEPQTAIRAQVEQLPRYRIENTYGITACHYPGDDGACDDPSHYVVEWADVLALCAETPHEIDHGFARHSIGVKCSICEAETPPQETP